MHGGRDPCPLPTKSCCVCNSRARMRHGHTRTMKQVKRTPVPLPGSKPRAQPKDTPVKAPLSQEFIGSDDDSAADNQRKPKKAEKPKTNIAIHRPNGATKVKAKVVAKHSPTLKPAAKPTSALKEPTLQPVKTAAPAAQHSSSDDTDDSDASEEPAAAPRKGTSPVATSDSASDSSSDESNATELPQQSAQKPPNLPTQSVHPGTHAVEFRPAQDYVPPKGFNPVPVNHKTMSQSAHIFDALHGKQVWHISAPAGISIKDLKEIALERAMKGEAILDHKGTSYGFRRPEHGEDIACEVLVPQQNGYKSVNSRVSQTLHLQAVVQLPELSSKQADPKLGSEAAASITRSTIRAPRLQLKGLKMRFRPSGSGGGDLGTLGDSESEAEILKDTAGLGMPNKLNLPSRPRKDKRKLAETNGDATTESPARKHKKHRTPEEAKRRDEAKRAKKEKKRAHEAARVQS
ncbi:DNA-directed RNA polymerase I subunit RPA34.5-domain-containing protein [Paraphoma chrysanthemicola]|uniref:DNA-directed RNA polymerase I subunit RPA34.5-domain-containing protein n=1 Tax=Paraphoma chrysanthemicola TaxID=798071 RepID=A0A8K0W4T2_9PLEO|nr:DNA-directed RNA polymerase I subunit RPA34.5-domain-containing protein [Paraphoma chrysanthemicola]